jgi:lipid-binding SYLF domain-containing protein
MSKFHPTRSLMLTATVSFVLAATASAQPLGAVSGVPQIPSQETQIVNNSTQVINEIMAIPAQAIPHSLLREAAGLAIIPGMVKGGFIVGVNHGRGVVITRNEGGQWNPPFFVTITGGSIGWQAGLQSTDLVLVFRTQRCIQNLANGKFTIGADASAAAGPVGRDASIGTDARLQAEIISYSRSRGLFAGVSINGSSMQVDGNANARFYGGAPGANGPLPEPAVRLMQTVASFSGPQPAVVPVATPATAPTVAAGDVLPKLVDSSRRLEKILDPQWQTFLALPTEVYEGTGPGSIAKLEELEDRFNTVAGDPQFKSLSTRSEFQLTFGLLKSYVAQLHTGALSALPPPPPIQ